LQKATTRLTLDGRDLEGALPLEDDGRDHQVIATMIAGPAQPVGAGQSPVR
jgi:hypothetical protein